MTSKMKPYSICGFSSFLSNSQVKCPPDVQLDMKVRISTVRTVHRDDRDGLDGPKRAVVSLCCVWTGAEGGGPSCLQQICGTVSASKHRVLDECRPHRRQQESCTSATTSLVVTAAATR
jgi:hypothetical protein